MMKLNKDIMDKFNKLFFEVAEYYHLEHKLHWTSKGIYAIATKYLDCIDAEMVTIDIFFNKIKKEYPNLFPFIKISKAYIFKSIGDYQEYISEETFEEINDIIKKIRKENLVTGIKIKNKGVQK